MIELNLSMQVRRPGAQRLNDCPKEVRRELRLPVEIKIRINYIDCGLCFRCSHDLFSPNSLLLFREGNKGLGLLGDPRRSHR